MAATPDARVEAIEKVLTEFADTEFKAVLLQVAVQSEQQKGDYERTTFYCQRLLEADPKNAYAMVTLATETARHIRENDLDKNENLAKVDKWAKDGIEAAKVLPKPRPEVPDADWETQKKGLEAEGWTAMGMAAALRKNFDGAVTDYQESLKLDATPDPSTLVRLAQAYISGGKLDQAGTTLDQAIATPNVNPQIRSIAESLKADVAKRKAAGGAAH